MKYIKKFQRKHGLVPDGIIGNFTIDKMMKVFSIHTITSMAHFLGQIAEETGNFKYGVENLNYSARGLQRIFGRYFPTRKKALRYARNPEKIANYVYADKYRKTPLGNTNDGDGWKYRGRGAIQITGKANYTAFAKAMKNQRILTNPEIVETDYYWETALWFFDKRNIWEKCNIISANSIKKVTLKVNGGYNGLEHRINLTFHFHKLLKNA
jgi:putative chitinase